MYSHYTGIYSTDMSVNEEKLRYHYNVEDPLKGIIKILNERADFTAAMVKPVIETQVVSIMYVLVVEMGQYPEDCWAWRTQETESWTAFQSHFIKYQSYLKQHLQILRQWSYQANNLIGIEEEISNFSQSEAEDRTEVTNLTGATMNLATQVA